MRIDTGFCRPDKYFSWDGDLFLNCIPRNKSQDTENAFLGLLLPQNVFLGLEFHNQIRHFHIPEYPIEKESRANFL